MHFMHKVKRCRNHVFPHGSLLLLFAAAQPKEVELLLPFRGGLYSSVNRKRCKYQSNVKIKTIEKKEEEEEKKKCNYIIKHQFRSWTIAVIEVLSQIIKASI